MDAASHISIRFLIGLSNSLDIKPLEDSHEHHTAAERAAYIRAREETRRAAAREALSATYRFGAFYDGEGLWQGKREPCMSFEVILADCPQVREVARNQARNLARLLDQDCIGVAIAPVQFTTYGAL